MMNLRVSSKKQAKIKLALQGCAGSGKTYSALLLAYGLCSDWSKIAVIDSENGSADLYASLGQYNVLPLQDNFTPENYTEAIEVCENAGMEVIIIDSISQCWDNLLEYHGPQMVFCLLLLLGTFSAPSRESGITIRGCAAPADVMPPSLDGALKVPNSSKRQKTSYRYMVR